ncbi:MAG: DegT/DnrJ/EryC1/StrS family aminotransferase [Candidatus Endonucleobacter bathymodioli]|uniref:DegT/DnrJ/EryC1/StrS family aminotransferase n=1 Tax=Candidatus Endonucleibacter bathymodioli TaxID=539814 RepID=A0AA90NTH9_9GAMM|nr:DegT/DnrJ/EryC1/StrS family aminotransferase [Candidatus Endonucleobacter bathymodioli]MDP0590140.1 DegT/DnrJ/EryC1/StrS family aminotransferase [Candidatus Endonucleobacter bathymodioli]
MKVPFFDLKRLHVDIRGKLDEAYRRVLDLGWVIQGSELEAFEKEFADYCEA